MCSAVCVCLSAPRWCGRSCVDVVCAIKCCARRDPSIATPLPAHPSGHPSMPCSLSSLIPSLCLHTLLPADIPLPIPLPFFASSLSSLHPVHHSIPPLPAPSLLLSLPLSFHGHLKWLQINQRHSTEFASEPSLWENEAMHPGVCHPHN